MTQLLLFEAPQSSVCFASPVHTDVVAEPGSQEPAAGDVSAAGAESSSSARSPQPLPQLDRSLPLYDPGRGEIHRFGDLAQGVISRYEIVAKRRAVLLARGPREAARA